MDLPNTSDARAAARRAGDSPVVENGARVGYAVNGLLHILIGYLALKIAWGGGGRADQSGALGQLASNGLGQAVLWVAVAGFALLALWQLAEAVTGAHGAEAGDRAKAVAKAVLYAVLASTALTFAMGGRSSSSAQTRGFTASMLANTAGRLLIALVGLVVVGVGGYHVYKGWRQKFLEDLEEHPGMWAVVAGRAGYVAKGIALAVVGILFVVAAWTRSSKDATGLDGALRALREQPAGTALLSFVALGFVAFGVYCFARSRYAKV